MTTHVLHKRWLEVTALLLGAFGPVFFSRLDGATTFAHPDTRLEPTEMRDTANAAKALPAVPGRVPSTRMKEAERAHSWRS